MSFSDFDLDAEFVKAIDTAGYRDPTELQQVLMPLALSGRDVLIWSQSAAGKTGAFIIPAIHRILTQPREESNGPRILVLTSRRDRVSQITYTIKRLSAQMSTQTGSSIHSGFIMSGRPYPPQMRLLRRPLDILVSTPGRLNDLVNNNRADFSRLEILIIDDLSSIYHKDMHQLIDKIKEMAAPHQTLTFSQKNDDSSQYAKQLMVTAEEVEIDEREPLQRIPQALLFSDDHTHKIALMDHLLDEYKGKRSIIFVAAAAMAENLAESLRNHGHKCMVATADLTQEDLQEVNNLVVSDQSLGTLVLAQPDHVINFDLPIRIDNYQARLLGKDWTLLESKVLSLVTPREADLIKRVEKLLGARLKVENIPGLEPTLPFASFRVVDKRNRSGNDCRGARRNHNHNGSGRQHAKSKGRFNHERGNGYHHQHAQRKDLEGKNSRRQNLKGKLFKNTETDRERVEEEDKLHRSRKGKFGRLNGGANRKRAQDVSGDGLAYVPVADNAQDGVDETWEGPATPAPSTPTPSAATPTPLENRILTTTTRRKKVGVLIRYREKRRRQAP